MAGQTFWTDVSCEHPSGGEKRLRSPGKRTLPPQVPAAKGTEPAAAIEPDYAC